MSLRVTVSSVTTGEIPALHGASRAFTNGGSLNVDPLTDFKMARADAIPDWQEVLWADLELSQVRLRGQVVLQKVTSLRLVDLANMLLSDADLDRVDTVALSCLDLRDLATVELDNRAGHKSAPLIPKVRHAHLVADRSHA